MTKVLLIKFSYFSQKMDPEDSTYFRAWPPLSLLNCAALLKSRGFKVELLDQDTGASLDQKALEIAPQFDCIFITSSSLDRWQCPNLDFSKFLSFTERLAKKNKNIYVLGYHGTVNPELVLKRTQAKAVVRGEPEMTVVDLCQAENFKEVLGISYLSKSGRVVHNQERKLLEMENLPLPAFDLLDLDNYSFGLMGDRLALLETSRGCPFNCSFCVKNVMYGPSVRSKKFEQIAREIDFVVDKLGAWNLHFFDLELSNDLKMVEKIADYLIFKKYSVNWCCQMRIEKLTMRLLRKMKKSGCSLICIGVESGSERVLKKVRKRITKKELRKKLKLVRKAGIRSICFFILGFPFETQKDFLASIFFARKLNPAYVSFHLFNPYPGCRIGLGRFLPNGDLKGSCHSRYSGKQLSFWSKLAEAYFYLNLGKILELIQFDRRLLKRGIRIFFDKMRR